MNKFISFLKEAVSDFESNDRYTIEQMIKANSKPILQFDKEEKFIKEWKSIREASNELNIKHSYKHLIS